jgi:hypothetical protein
MDRDMTHADVQAWLDRYVDAWQTYDAAAIGDLFSDDAVYRYHPWDGGDDVLHGRAEIVESWLNPGGAASERDEPGTWSARYEPWLVAGNRAVAIGESVYYTDATQATEDRRYFNNWLLEFDDEGRCRRFVEYYMKRRR